MRTKGWIALFGTVATCSGAGVYVGTQLASAAVIQAALFANLSGSAEVGPDGRRGAGDPDGWGGAVVTVKGTQVCFGMTVNLIGTPTAAHVHLGNPSQAGPVVVPLTAPTTGDPGASSGCTAVPAGTAAAIAAHPHRYYVNVHNQQFPGGAIRGQLFSPTQR